MHRVGFARGDKNGGRSSLSCETEGVRRWRAAWSLIGVVSRQTIALRGSQLGVEQHPHVVAELDDASHRQIPQHGILILFLSERGMEPAMQVAELDPESFAFFYGLHLIGR